MMNNDQSIKRQEHLRQTIAQAYEDRSHPRGPAGPGVSTTRQEGIVMKSIERTLRGLGRFVFGLGVGLALTSALVIVVNGPALDAKNVGPADPIRLDPIVVTISAARFDALRGEDGLPAIAVHGAGGPKDG